MTKTQAFRFVLRVSGASRESCACEIPIWFSITLGIVGTPELHETIGIFVFFWLQESLMTTFNVFSASRGSDSTKLDLCFGSETTKS